MQPAKSRTQPNHPQVLPVHSIAANGNYYTVITDDLGEAQKKPIPFGMYDLKCNVPGYLPFLLKKYKMVRGKVNKVEVVLEREAE